MEVTSIEEVHVHVLRCWELCWFTAVTGGSIRGWSLLQGRVECIIAVETTGVSTNSFADKHLSRLRHSVNHSSECILQPGYTKWMLLSQSGQARKGHTGRDETHRKCHCWKLLYGFAIAQFSDDYGVGAARQQVGLHSPSCATQSISTWISVWT